MCRRQREGTANREYSIGHYSQLRMCDGCANNQQQHTDSARGDDANVSMAPKPDCERKYAEWQYDDQHL